MTAYELRQVTKSMQNGKDIGLDEIPAEVWRSDEFQEFLLESCNRVYTQEVIERWIKGCILPFPKKVNLSITKKYRGITQTSIAAKIFNLMILNRINRSYTTENSKWLKEKQINIITNFNNPSQILECVKSKNLPITLLFIDFQKCLIQ